MGAFCGNRRSADQSYQIDGGRITGAIGIDTQQSVPVLERNCDAARLITAQRLKVTLNMVGGLLGEEIRQVDGRRSVMRCLLQHLLSPFVQALTTARAGFHSRGMHSRIDSKHHPATGRSFRRLRNSAACFHVAVHGNLKGIFEFGNRHTMEGDDVIDIHNPANDDLVLGIEVHAGLVALVGHGVHDAAPIFAKNSRVALTL